VDDQFPHEKISGDKIGSYIAPEELLDLGHAPAALPWGAGRA